MIHLLIPSKDLRKDVQNKLLIYLNDIVPQKVLTRKNKAKSWQYGYNEDYDFVVISKDGTVGDVVEIQGVRIALPMVCSNPIERSKSKKEQYWQPLGYPKELTRIKTIFQWNEMPADFKDRWVDFVEREFDRRESGAWFMNNGVPTYITGSHYTYLQWTKIDVGLPDFREWRSICSHADCACEGATKRSSFD